MPPRPARTSSQFVLTLPSSSWTRTYMVAVVSLPAGQRRGRQTRHTESAVSEVGSISPMLSLGTTRSTPPSQRRCVSNRPLNANAFDAVTTSPSESPSRTIPRVNASACTCATLGSARSNVSGVLHMMRRISMRSSCTYANRSVVPSVSVSEAYQPLVSRPSMRASRPR
jgi:hypothetical protein